MRLDRALVARGLARSRTHAADLIDARAVTVDGAVATKASHSVPDAAVVVVAEGHHYVSRAAHKLAGALDTTGIDPAGRVALDAGASTGGFTQVLLERGAAHVFAVDVGHGQLAPSIAADARVTAIEGLNVRDLKPGHLQTASDGDNPATASGRHAGYETAPSLIVADLSFISLTLVIEQLVAVAASPADLLLMVKPQFEVGRARLNKHGVVTNPDDHAWAVAHVAQAMSEAGVTLHHIARSALPGPTGNVEFFVWGSTAWQARDARRTRLEPAAVADAIERETGGRP